MPDPIGDVLTRKPKRKDARDRIRVTGTVNGGWVCESADTFDTPFWLSEAELARDYGAKLEAVESDDARLRRLDAEQNEKAAARRFHGTVTIRPEPDAASPEGQFRAADAAEAAAPADAATDGEDD